jgi:hypothetical protein
MSAIAHWGHRPKGDRQEIQKDEYSPAVENAPGRYLLGSLPTTGLALAERRALYEDGNAYQKHVDNHP